MLEQDGTGMSGVLGWNGDECWSRMEQEWVVYRVGMEMNGGTGMGDALGWNGDEWWSKIEQEWVVYWVGMEMNGGTGWNRNGCCTGLEWR